MAFIKKSSITALQEQADIVEIIDGYVPLKRSGSNFKARCPFHEEKTPSFTVSQQKQKYYCFGCGANGNVFTFLQEYVNLSFVEAVEDIANRYSFQLEYENNFEQTDKRDENEKIEILEKLNDWFQSQLFGNQLQYVLSRGVRQETIKKFKIGFAPKSFEVLRFFLENKIDYKIAEELGVVAFDESGNPYSRFSERIMFPIFSNSGKIIAFGGRTIVNHPAKYLNSPTTKLFNKSKVLYGYNFAKKDIAKQKKAFVVEGYLDVVMLSQSGIENVVAPLGTAFSETHLPLFKRAGNPIISFAFDGDRAGINATKRALEIVLPTGYQTRVSLFTDGLDPADFVKNGHVDEVKKLLENGENGATFYLKKIIEKYNLENPYEKAEARKEGFEAISKFPKEIREEYENIFKVEFLREDVKFEREKIQIRENKNKANSDFGKFELSLIRSIIENRELLAVIDSEFGEQGFKYHQEAFLDLKKGLDSEEVLKISLMECNIFTKDDIQIEIINHRIRQNFVERENILKQNIPFLEKGTKIRENSLELNILKKKKSQLLTII
jgi:DNA primase